MGGRSPGHGLGRCIIAVGGPITRVLWRIRVLGRENVPDGPAILCCNHVSNLDPILVNFMSPRFLRFMAKAEMFATPLGEWFWLRVGAFPVKRGVADRAALSTAAEILEDGGILGVFPEGTRTQGEGLGEAHQGAAFLAVRTGAPIVPSAIHGTAGVWPKGAWVPRFPRITIVFGEPIRSEEFGEGARRQRIETMTAEVMARIARLLEEAGGA